MDPKLITEALDALIAGDAPKALELLKALVATAAGAPAADMPPEADPTAPPADPAANAAASTLCRLSGRASVGEALKYVEIAIAALRKSEADASALELTSRQELVGDLVKLGAELPSTAWEGDATARNPVARLLGEPIASLRSRVELLRATKPGAPKSPKAPERTDVVELSADDQERANSITDPDKRAKFIKLRTERLARNGSSS
jgi:hypothetical protein